MADRTVVEEVTDRIAFQIASGAYEPGERLPSVRQLAKDQGINPSTVQVVLGRLQSAGFVEAHRGIGLIVRDVRLYGGLETWRFLFRFSTRLPELASSILTDILASRRLLIASSLRAIAESPGAHDPAPVRRAVDRLELLAGGGPDGRSAPVADLAKAEFHVYRMTMVAAGGGVSLGILNSVSEMMLDLPEVLEALFADPADHVRWWRRLVDAWADGTLNVKALGAADVLVRDWDAAVLDRFRARLGVTAP